MLEPGDGSVQVELHGDVQKHDLRSLWVFAYGSLCWKPGFAFDKAVVGFVKGFDRRFWQGNTTHRGSLEKPGRVATLVESTLGNVYGVAYAISGEAAIPYLSNRECELGGYITQFTDFYPSTGPPFKVLLYVATPRNPLWLGDGKLEDIALQISNCSGPSGHNVEYLVRLANFMRQHFPQQVDDHLYSLEKAVLSIITQEKKCIKSLMGNGEGCISFVTTAHPSTSRNTNPAEPERIESFEHTTRLPDKKLRCLNI